MASSPIVLRNIWAKRSLCSAGRVSRMAVTRDCLRMRAVLPAMGDRWQRQTMTQPLTFLGIESSCDDTAAAVVRVDGSNRAKILASVVEGQTELHAAFGGVVPEIAARAHAERLDHCVERALGEAGLGLGGLGGIAVTAGPGLIGGVLSGVMLAKGLAAATGLPLVESTIWRVMR